MIRADLRTAVALFVIVAAAYGLTAWDRLLRPSPQFHFVDLAQSFLDGRLDTDTPEQPAWRTESGDPRGYRDAIRRTVDAGGWNDWAAIRTLTLRDGTVVRGVFPWAGAQDETRHLFHTLDNEERKVVIPGDLARTCGENGRSLCDRTDHYVSFPPFPGVAMIPFVAVWGYDTNDVLITVLVGALNAVLLFLFLQLLVRRGHSTRSRRDNAWLAIAFALGTAAFFASNRGEVWFSALVFGVALNVLFMMAALDLRHPILAGLFLGLGMATRTPIAFCVAFFAWQLFMPQNRWQSGRWREILVKGTLFSLPLLAVGGLLLAYNQARFGLPFEFGHSFLSGGAADRVRDHGLFSTWYLNLNLQAALVNVPRVIGDAPFVLITKHGLGLLFSTPILFLLMRPAAMPPIRRALWLAVAAAAIPGLLYQNTGWEQFAYRFAMDYLPYLIALLAVGGRPLTGRVKAVILFGVAVNLFGAITFGRMPWFYY
ncbi:MAG: hypothetical protein H6744_11595 [Deltaproteobacteria bacterium]|nr:hypothetical protein [Deltaproteobacteria bacterium]MCB9787320.1 hypothetical protein [Deltaproteobacteria bacterium]